RNQWERFGANRSRLSRDTRSRPHARPHSSALSKQVPVHRRSSRVVTKSQLANRFSQLLLVFVDLANALDGKSFVLLFRMGVTGPRPDSSRFARADAGAA